ncbi:MAG: hypothetical protein JNL92_21770 [Opitutaceae bacterium]|nr:hypothetical protein [Opitutaceae bacterium]
MIVRCAPPALLALTALLASCSKPEVETYRVSKDTTAPAAAAQPESPHPAMSAAASGASAPAQGGGSAMASTPVATASGPGLTWTAPAHWKAKPGSAMRKGSYAITGEGGEADLAITAFPGDVGGDLANLNRWRGQIQLPPVAPAEFEASRQRLERNGLQMTVVDIVGTGANAQRILGAMIPYGGATWFVKLMGPDALVAKEKAAFTAFLDTVKATPAAK